MARRSPGRWIGPLVAVAGVAMIVAGGVVAGSRTEDAVEKLARAPVGCSTTLEFDDGGTYRLYVETQGSLDSLEGDCDAESPYDADGEPSVDMTLVDADGDEIELTPSDAKSYDAGGFVGEETATAEIPDAGEYELTVESDEQGFVVAVGKDPEGDSTGIRNLLAGIGAVLVVAGVVITILGLRANRTPRAPAPARPGSGPGSPDAPWSSGPPLQAPSAPPTAWSQPSQWPPANQPPPPPSGWGPDR
jgi:hypothetical protein